MKRFSYLFLSMALLISAASLFVSCNAENGTADGGADGGGWSAYCIRDAKDAVPAGLVPIPRYFRAAAVPISLVQRTISVSGGSADEAAEVAAIAQKAGLSVQPSGASIQLAIHDHSEWEPLTAECGLAATAAAGAYYISVRPATGTVLGTVVAVDVFGRDSTGTFHALKTLKQHIAYSWPVFTGRTILDWPGTDLRGVLEGFYGLPWDKDDRINVIGQFADLKLNYYIYAPKDDPTINIGWRNDFLPEDAKYIRRVADAGKKNRVNICWELHPGNMITFSSPEDFQMLMKKYAVMAAQGVNCFILAFDDVQKILNPVDEGVYPSYIEAQVDLGNRVGAALHERYPDALLGFVPADYWTGSDGTQTDLRYLGLNLSQVWHVAWTGTEVVSKTITAADAAAIAEIIRRPPFLGDNFPVADMPGTSGVLNLGPLVGREPGLPALTSGFVFNAMPYPYSSVPSLATSADYLWNPQGYEAGRSMEAVAQALAGPSGWEGFGKLCSADHDQYLEPTAAPELDARLYAFFAAWESGSDLKQPANDLGRLLAAYEAVPAGLARALGWIDPGLLAEVTPWSDKLGAYGTAGAAALGMLLQKSEGKTPDPSDVARLKSDSAALKKLKPRPTGKLMDDFLAKAVQLLGG